MKILKVHQFNESIEWELEDEMDPKGEDQKAVESEYGDIIEYVDGKMNETDGDFEVKLKNGDKISYYYKYHPFPPEQFKKEKQYIDFTINGKTHRYGADEYLEEYVSNYGLNVYGAMKMYDDVHLKFTSKKLRKADIQTGIFDVTDSKDKLEDDSEGDDVVDVVSSIGKSGSFHAEVAKYNNDGKSSQSGRSYLLIDAVDHVKLNKEDLLKLISELTRLSEML